MPAGRPKIDDEKRKEKTLVVRFTKEEYERISNRAKEKNVDISKWATVPSLETYTLPLCKKFISKVTTCGTRTVDPNRCTKCRGMRQYQIVVCDCVDKQSELSQRAALRQRVGDMEAGANYTVGWESRWALAVYNAFKIPQNYDDIILFRQRNVDGIVERLWQRGVRG